MPLNIARLLFTYLPMTIFYTPWAASTLMCALMTPKSRLRRPRTVLFLFLSLTATAGGIMMLFFPNAGTWVLQGGVFLTAMLLFREPLRDRLIGFLVTIFALVIPETISCNLFLMVHSVLLKKPLSATSLNSLTSIGDMILLNAIYISIGVFFIRKASSLLREFSGDVHLGAMALIMIPTVASTLTSGIVQHHEDSPYFSLRFFAYWLIALACFFPILKGFQIIRRLEAEHAALKASMNLVKTQLEYAKEMEQEFQSIRKWNHDMENHLFSLNYLIDSGKYDKASEYLDSLFLDEDMKNTAE